MKVVKKVIAKLNKCYATTIIKVDGKRYILSAAEKDDPCFMFDLEGNKVDTIWENDGGVMTLEQIKGNENIFLATNRFYSQNNSSDARIVKVVKEEKGWRREVIKNLPFVHRFGVLENKDEKFLVACTIKSDHAYKDDWTCPGRIWACKLPKSLDEINENNQLEMTPLMSGLYKNHGFCKIKENGLTCALIGSENGVFKVIPPNNGNDFVIEKLLDVPTSDMLYGDFDGDGVKELLTINTFHGDVLQYYRYENNCFKLIQEFKDLEFLHAIWLENINGKDYGFLGNRKGNQELFVVYYDDEKKELVKEILDEHVGPANCMVFENNQKKYILSNNRETDEVAMYEIIGV